MDMSYSKWLEDAEERDQWTEGYIVLSTWFILNETSNET
jgi:hypothetical protein